MDINYTGEVDFNASMNRLLHRAQGELVISLQDYIKVPPEGILGFLEAYKNGAEFMTAPVGHCDTEEYTNPTWDWRKSTDKCNWDGWEIDWGAAPRQALLDIGGFDEELDKGWGFDNLTVGKKAEKAGYSFMCLKDNPALGYNHKRGADHEFADKRDPHLYQNVLRSIEMDQ